MRRTSSISFTPKLPHIPCKKFFHILKSPYKKHVSIRALRFRNLRRITSYNCGRPKGGKIHTFVSKLRPTEKQDERLDFVTTGTTSMVESMRDTVPNPTPLTPSTCVSLCRIREGVETGEDVDEACRCFENYLVEMMVEGRKVGDLIHVEELIGYWNDLNDPVFVELVSRFYVEMCKDLFLLDEEEEEENKEGRKKL